MPSLSLRLGVLASLVLVGSFASAALLTSCNLEPGAGDASSKPAAKPTEPVGVAQEAVGSPCTKDLQGLGAIGGGWFGIRTDGTVWLPNTDINPIGAPSERVNSLGTDNAALADMDGEALHNCVLKTNGDIWCWGMNEHSQLGGGFTSMANEPPTKVLGLPSAAKQVAVGIDTSCALLMDGSVWCWGSNQHGQLGNGLVDATNDQLTPTQASVGTGNDVLTVGYWHGCVLKAGTVTCWGDDLYGEVGVNQAGDDGTHTHATPAVARTGVTQVSAGGFYTCTVQTDNSLWCWGDNFWGQLGQNDQSGRYVPTQVAALGNTVSFVDTAVHATCAIVTGGVVKCWGSEDAGRLGNGLINPNNPAGLQLLPAPVSGPLGSAGGAVKIRETEGAACVLKSDGHVFCWGGGGFLDGQPETAVPVEVDFCSLPTLDSISPNFGIYTGGTVVTFTGTEFKAGATVDIGNKPGIAATVMSPTSLQITTPDYTFTDTVDVVVNNPDGKHARLLKAFSFTAPPTVAQVLPGSGSTLGGDTVTISGSNFLPTSTFDFGGALATNVTITDVNTATAVTPAHAAGPVDVTATNPGGLTFTAPMAFTFVPALSVTALTPTSGPTAGGTTVTFTGDGFDFNTAVKFDGIDATNVVLQDAQTMSVTTPAHPQGAVDVTVIGTNNGTLTLPGAYTFSDQASGAGSGATGTGAGGGGGKGAYLGPGNGCYCSAAERSSDGPLGAGLALAGLGFTVLRWRRRASRAA